MSLLSTQAAHGAYAHRPADERFPSLDAMVAAAIEDRNLSLDRTYNAQELRAQAGDDGQLRILSPKGSAAAFTHWSFGQVARTVGAPAAYLRDGLSPALAADCLNYGLTQLGPGSRVNLLLRAANGTPEPTVRACTSDSYGRVWDADLYGAIQKTIVERDEQWQLPPTWEGPRAGAYRGDRDSFLVITNGGSIVTDPSARNGQGGDAGAMYRGLLVRNSEVGAAAVTIESILFRFICGNHLLWGAIHDQAFKRRHVGTNVLRATVSEINRIAYKWINESAARDEQIIANLIRAEIASTKEGVIDELRALGATKEQAESMYARCEQTEAAAPRSFWGLAQGATRISQDSPYQDERYQLDRLAAQILARGARRVAA